RASRARWQRDLTVPSATPSSTAASAQVRPSSTVASMAERSSGDRAASAGPRRPCSMPTNTWSSAETTTSGSLLRQKRPAGRPGLPADAIDQAADPDSPDERGHVPVPAVRPGLPPYREKGILNRLIDEVLCGATPG